MKISNFFSVLNISSKGLSLEKTRLALTAENIANASTTKTQEGTPYQRKAMTREVVAEGKHFFKELRSAKLKLQTTRVTHLSEPNYYPAGLDARGLSEIKSKIHEREDFKSIYEPGHPDADENGVVTYPNISVINEMLELISASRAYEANISVMNATKQIAKKSMEI